MTDPRSGDARARLDQLPIFQFLPDDLRRFVVDSFVSVEVAFGDVIVAEGDPAAAFFVVVSGRARVFATGVNGEELPLGTLSPGDSFGEIALLEDARRTASVRASSAVELMKLDRTVFAALLRSHPDIRDGLALAARYRTLNSFLRTHSAFAELPPPDMHRLVSELEEMSIDADTKVVREGEAADAMYVVADGRLRVAQAGHDTDTVVRYLRTGDFFGELALFQGTQRTATVESVTGCRLLRMTRATFEHLNETSPDFREQIEARIAQYDYRHVARVPLDFAEETVPAGALGAATGPEQVDTFVDQPGDAGAGRELARRPIRHFPLVHQIDEMDCGAACLAMICRHHGYAASLARIRELVNTGREGTSLRGLCAGATELGFEARSVKASMETLPELTMPGIVHFHGDHWVVVYDIDASTVRVADPAAGLVRMARDTFGERWSGYAAVFESAPEAADMPVAPGRTRVLEWFVSTHRRAFARATLVAVAPAILILALPVAAQLIVDHALVVRRPQALGWATLLVAAAVALAAGAQLIRRTVTSDLTLRLDGDVMSYFSHKLLTLPVRYFLSRRTGDIERRLQGIERVRDILVRDGVTAVAAIVQIVVTIGLVAFYSPRLALVLVALLGLSVWLGRLAGRAARPVQARLDELHAHYDARRADALHGIETIKSLGAEHAFARGLAESYRTLSERLAGEARVVATYGSMLQLLPLAAVAILLVGSAFEVRADRLSLGGLVAVTLASVMALAPVATLRSIWERFQTDALALDRLSDVLEQEPEQRADASLHAVPTLAGGIVLRQVGFRYGGMESPTILDDISFEITPGQTIGLIGRSGAGKTTLIKLIAGLLDPIAGSIRYDDVDLSRIDHRDLRRQIGCVLQEAHVFDDTIAANIAFGEVAPDPERLRWAAGVAHVDEFVSRLPWGYDTAVGRGGLALSPGQRQRIAIARAVYQEPAVMLLDEATTFLDAESAARVRDNLRAVMRDATVFIVTPRPSMIRDADSILVIEKGRLVERGDHDALMRREGLYYYLTSQEMEL